MKLPNCPPPRILTNAVREWGVFSLFFVGSLVVALFSCEVSQAGMLANWNFDDSSLADSSGNGFTLTKTPSSGSFDTGSFTYATNGDGSALSADGNISAYVDFGNAATLDSFTVSMWADVTPQGWDNYWTILGSSSTTRNDGNRGIRFQSRGKTRTSAGIFVNDITSFSPNGEFTLTDSGSYNHLVLSVANGKGTIYCNGTSIATLSNCTSTQMVGLFSLAGSVLQGSGDPRTMMGRFDNVAVYNRGLTDAEVGILKAAGSATSNVYADIYSRTLSGTAGTWSQSVWSHQFGESGTATANQAWTDYSQVKLGSSGNATLTIDQDIHTSKTTLANTGITLSVADGKTATLRGLNGSGFTKTGAGTIKIEGTENYAGTAANLVIAGGVLDITGTAQLFGTYNTSVVTVQAGGTLRIGNLVDYATSNLKALTSNNTARVFDGGTIEIVGGNQSGNNSFTVTSNGGTLLNSIANTIVTFGKHVDGSGVLHPLQLDGSLTVGGAGNFVFNAPFHGTGGLTKTGAGTVTIASSENTFTGDIIAQEGILAISGKTQSYISVRGGEVQLLSGANVTAERIRISDSSGLSGKTSQMNIQGGTLTITGTTKADTVNTNLMVGHWQGNAILNVTGGTLNVKNAWTSISWDGSGTLSISDKGVANLYGVNLHNDRDHAANLNVVDGGRLNVGEAGIFFVPTAEYPTQKGNKVVTFGDATVGAFADWSSSMRITLSGTGDGTVFDTTDSVDLATGRTITLSGPLSGTGGLNVAGNGTLVLSGANTYTGATTVVSGATLQLDGSIESSDLTLESGATLTGDGELAMNSLAAEAGSRIVLSLYEDGTYDSLDVTGKLDLAEGVLDFAFEGDLHAIADTPMTILTAGEMELPANLNDLLTESWRGIVDLSYLGTNGLVANISSASIPEPSTWILGLLGLLGGACLRRKK
ncbi:MAG: autotransporter-associated beta strand repeat-containing protein [Planctomycetia bacterium]|nr:autotransporter-associated beta strand repeat-containing protein [Planctomycetia bacterium]